MSYEDALQKAIEHRQTQNAVNVIEWNKDEFFLNMDSFFVDQSKSLLTVQSGKYLLKYRIKILGTYDTADSTFLWSNNNISIDNNLTTPIYKLISSSIKNHWPLPKTSKYKCTFDSAYQMTTLAFYLDDANGIYHLWTNNRRTKVIFTFYEIEVIDKKTNGLITRVPVAKHYNVVNAPDLIALCKNYVTEFDANERKYSTLHEEHNDDWKYLDTMFVNRRTISDKFWDTTNVNYVFFRKNRLQANLQNINWWKVIEVEGDKYVLCNEKETWGGQKTWSFKICIVDNRNKVCNEYLSF